MGVRRDRAVAWLARKTSEVVLNPRAHMPVVRALRSAEHKRALLHDMQAALWHFFCLPSRRDLHDLYRKTAIAAHKVAELDRLVGRLERDQG